MMNPFIFGGRHSLKPLSISRSWLLMRDVNSTKVPFGVRVVWYKATRSKMMACGSNDQIEPLTRTDLLLTKSISTPINPVYVASHVGGGANCMMLFLVKSGLPYPLAIEAFAMSVTDKSAAKFQIPVVAVARMVSASAVVVVVEQVSKQQPMPRDRFPTKDPRTVVQCSAR